MSNEFSGELEEILEGLGSVVFTNTLTSLVGLVGFVLGAIALYSLAKRRGIRHAWLAWIPIGNLWILGSLSDQYQYVSQKAVRNKRKAMLALSLIQLVLGLIMSGLIIGSVFSLVGGAFNSYSDEQMFESLMGPVLGFIFLTLPVSGIAIALMIIRFMALYNVYRSCAPENAVMFLVLSIIVRVTEPFFLFFNRQSDKGMVARQPQNPTCQAPSYMNAPENGGSWSEPQQNNDYSAYQTPEQPRQNPEGSPEPWTQKPEDQDPWNNGPEQL